MSIWKPKEDSHRIQVTSPRDPRHIQWALGHPAKTVCLVDDIDISSHYSGWRICAVIDQLRERHPDRTITVL